MAKAGLVITAVLAAIAVYTCVRIEIYNVQAGGFLPRRDMDEYANPKWRVSSPGMTRRTVRKRLLQEAELEGRPPVITEADQREIAAAAERAGLMKKFNEFVSSFGLLQYLVAPAALLGSVLLLCGVATKPRPLASRVIPTFLMCAASLVCVIMMFYRGYFSSLGV